MKKFVVGSGLATSTQLPAAQTAGRKPGFLPVPKTSRLRKSCSVTAADLAGNR